MSSAATPEAGGAVMPLVRAAASRPRHSQLSPGRIGAYAFLISSAVFFLLPLYVMLVTSLKPMDEVRLGHLFALPMRWTLEP